MSRKYVKFLFIGLFLLVILVPAGVLGILAVRALNHEEAYLEKNIKTTLMSEVNLIAERVRNELNTIRHELVKTIEIPAGSRQTVRFKNSLNELKKHSPLIDIPFLISPEREILYPLKGGPLNQNERSFLTANEPLFKDKITIPVYKNIARAYLSEIMETENEILSPEAVEQNDAAVQELRNRADTTEKAMSPQAFTESTFEAEATRDEQAETTQQAGTARSGGTETKAAIKTQSLSSAKEAPVAEKKRLSASSQRQMQVQAEQQALSRFEQDKTIQEKIYKQAEQKGEELLQRNITLVEKVDRLPQEQKSIFIAQPGNFSQIISAADSGMIPRIIDERFTLIFWKKYENGQIAGCTLNYGIFRERLAALLPVAERENRVLALLDADGLPLLSPAAGTKTAGAINWRLPFVASEIAEVLPRWEAAGYLRDPELITRTALSTAYLLGLLIVLLLAVLALGGLVLVRLFFLEIDLARKKTNFVANVSHELKTPLTSIRLFTEILKEQRQPDKEKQLKYYELMLSETERLTRLINNVLDFSRLEQNKKTFRLSTFEAGTAVSGFVESQRLRLEQNGFRLTFAGPDSPVSLESDEEALRQVLLNLLSNAEKYSPEKKEIEVELERTPGGLLIRVKDRGCGVPRQSRKKLFNEFYRADDSLTARVPGSGLGLAISRRLIRELGGDILYAPRDGGGSVFTVKLPFAGKQAR